MEEKVIDKNKSGMPVASLTLGIVSIVLSTFGIFHYQQGYWL